LIIEYIAGLQEYATHILCKNGKVLNHITYQHNFTHDYFILGREKVYTELSYCSSKTLLIMKTILERINYSGFCCFDYKVLNDKPIFFEINARMGYSLVKDKIELKKMLDIYLDQNSSQ